MSMSFVDDGPPFNPLAFHAPDLGKPVADRAVGGLGIHMVRALVHRARYRRAGGCNCLHLLRRIRLPGGRPANICSPSGSRRQV
jgi:serine/threonine-protein kinase RsbW